MLYDPREDSELLKKHIKYYARGHVLDMGTGSGILAVEAAQYCEKVTAVDVSQAVIDQCRKKYPQIEFYNSDLFSHVEGKFDCIFFNPPYLPAEDLEDEESALITTGGKFGWETIERFLFSATNHLKPDGVILLVFSTLTDKKKVEDLIEDSEFVWEEVAKQVIPWEILYLYVIRRK